VDELLKAIGPEGIDLVKERNNPPKALEVILQAFLSPGDRESLLGDFNEMYDRILKEGGIIRARFWYVFHIIKLIPVYVENKIYWSAAMFRNYLKIALRNIKRYKGFSFINIFGLAIGMAVFIIIGLNIQYELSYDTHFENADRIYRVASEVWQSDAHYYHVGTPGPLANTLVEEYPEVESAVKIWKWTTGEVNLVSEKKSIFENLFYASPEVFDFFGIPFVNGDPETSMRDPFSIVLSEKLAEKYFGRENPVGKTFTYRDRLDFTITGIFKNMPDNSHFKMDLITPFSTFVSLNGDWINRWNAGGSHCYILLRERADPIELEKKFPQLLEKHRVGDSAIEENYKDRLFLQPLKSIHLHSNIRGEFSDNYNIKYIYIFSSLGFIILIIAFVNYMNLSVTQSFRRSTEVGMRKVVGARKGQLVKQFLGESIIITFVVLIISIVLAAGVLPVINNILGRQLNFSLIENPQFPQYILGAVILIIMIGILAGSYPAFLISSTRPVSILKGKYFGKIKGNMLRNLLIAFQFSITIFALISTMIVRNQLNYINSKDIGYNKEQILVLDVKRRNEVLSNIQTLKTEFLRNPNILAVSCSSNLPNDIFRRGNSEFPQKDSVKPFEFCVNSVDYDFVDVYGIEIVEGRNFSRDFSSDMQGAVLINEKAAKNCAWDSPVGREFRFWGNWSGRIVGIMKDFHIQSLHYPLMPVFFVLVPQYEHTVYISIKIKTGNIPDTIGYIKNTFKDVVPNFPLDYYFFDEAFNRDYMSDHDMGRIFSGFAILTIFIACLGFFGLVAFSAQQRTKEIGIRKVLGANISNLLVLLTKEFVQWVIIANIFAWPLAYYFMNKWLQSFAYRIDLNVWIFILSGLAALVIALLTISYQIIKAATANPVDSLRYE
jgi:putative ABC transport system permease protein